MKTILVVDDNLVSLKQISAQLSDHYEVSLAKSGELALQICGQVKPDLILLDVEMPEMNGFETIARLKRNPALSYIPVIFLTGNHDAATEIKGLESGAMDFITKPANSDILRHRIELHLQFSAYQRSLENIVHELEDTIGVSFAELVECKDFNIAGHVLRTAGYMELLGTELHNEGVFGKEISLSYVDLVKRAAPFHDIGKIGISDTILLKRGPLTGEEYESVKQHTVIGSQMIETIFERTPSQQYLKTAAEIAFGHHEQFDGKGYPRGLRGDEIPLSCRIMAVANVYDACVTDRVYRKGLSHEQACEAILQGRGSQFDPRIVDTFSRIREKFALLHVQSQFESKDRTWSFYHEANFSS